MILKNKIDIQSTLSTIDWVIFALTLFITFGFVVYGQLIKSKSTHTNNEESMLDLLIMGRKLTAPMFVATLVATWYGGIFGVTEIAFKNGIYNFITQGFFWYLAYIIFALFLIDKISPYKAVTLPDLIGKMFGEKSAKISGVFNFFNVLPIAYIISLGIFIQQIFQMDTLPAMIIGVTVVVIYSFFGGFRAVVFSDIFQFIIMCSAVFLVLVFSFYHFGDFSFLQEKLPAKYFSLTGGNGVATTLVWGFIALSTLVDPNFYQRCFAAKSTKVAKKGILVSTLIWFCFDICTTAGAMYAAATIPNAESNYAYLTYSIQVLPTGIKGLLLAGILATILSTLDSYLFLAGTTLAYDLAPRKYRNNPWLHHLGILLVGLLGVIIATLFDGNIKTVWKTLGSYSASCLLLPVVIGHIFPQRISDNQFVSACIIGTIGTTWWRLAPQEGFWSNIDELYIGVLFTFTTLVIYEIYKKISRSTT